MLQEIQSKKIRTKNCPFDVTIAEKAGLWWFGWKKLSSCFILLFAQLKDTELIRLKRGRSVDWRERINLFEVQPNSTNLIYGYSMPGERERSCRHRTCPQAPRDRREHMWAWLRRPHPQHCPVCPRSLGIIGEGVSRKSVANIGTPWLYSGRLLHLL